MITRQIGDSFLNSVIYGLLLFQNVMVTGLKMENVFVPESGLHGGAVTLKCDFQQESDQLLNLKWYLNGSEFYRYLPDTREHVATFPSPGFTVQRSNATLHKVTIRNLTLAATGVYRCEILADKTFQTLFQERNFTVIVPPDPVSPKINNISSTVHMGDTISGNCTSFRSRPAAQLTFHINDEKVEGPYLREYRPVSEDVIRAGEKMQLYTSNLGLQFQVTNNHFRQGVVAIKCVATIGTRRWVKDIKIQHSNFLSRYSPSQHSFGTRVEVCDSNRLLWFVGALLSLEFVFLRFHEIMD